MRRLSPFFAALAIASLPILGLWLTAAPAMAACQVDASPVAFGVVDVSRNNDSNGEITLDCTIATAVEVALSSAAPPGQRTMGGPNGGQLIYELYPDATRSLPWGDGSGGSTTRAVTSNGDGTTRLTIYGRVPAQDPVPPGSYGDALSVIVSF